MVVVAKTKEDVVEELKLIKFVVLLEGLYSSKYVNWPHAPAVLSVAVKLIVLEDAPRS